MQISLLKHQKTFIEDLTTNKLALCAGFGAGKSQALVYKILYTASRGDGTPIIACEPTIPLIRKILVPLLEEVCDSWGVKYTYHDRDSTFTLHNLNNTIVYLTSFENYDRIIGLSVNAVFVDEFDTTATKIAVQAYYKLLARIRAGNILQFNAVSTPEGFRAMHHIWVENKNENTKLIRAKTYDNIFLPENYIDNMRESYPPELFEAYINGEFVNLTQGRVYPTFDRSDCIEGMIEPYSTIHIGMDFNITDMSCVVVVEQGDKWVVIDALKGYYDTPELIKALIEKYNNCHITVYPDASCQSRSSSGGDTTNYMLLKDAGFKVVVRSKNPPIRSRIGNVNRVIATEKLLIHKNAEHMITSLEKLVYTDKGVPEHNNNYIDGLSDSIGYLVFSVLEPKAVHKLEVRRNQAYSRTLH